MTVPISDRLSQLYVGNGTNTRFDFTFRVFNQEDATGIAIRKKGTTEFETVDPSTYTVTLNQDGFGGCVTFNAPPSSSVFFYIAGATPLDQLLDITNYDNFYPDAIERALDKLTALLQEWGTQLDQEKQARILADIHYDSLAMEREENLENRLISYINAVVGITNPKIFDGITDRMVITVDGRTQREFNASIPFWTDEFVRFKQETYLREEQILDHADQQNQQLSVSLFTAVETEKQRALAVEGSLQTQVNEIGGRAGVFGFNTYADFDAVKGTIPSNSVVKIGEVNTGSAEWGQGENIWNGVVLKKSPYDPLTQAINYTNSFDSLKLNKGKVYPFRKTSRNGITSQESTIWNNFILDVRVNNADPTKYYQIAYQQNGATINGKSEYNWIIYEFDKATFPTAAVANLVVDYSDAGQPQLVKSGTIQTVHIKSIRKPKLSFSITCDTSAMPAGTTPIRATLQTDEAWSFVIDPSRYVFEDTNLLSKTDAPRDWLYNKGINYPFVQSAFNGSTSVANSVFLNAIKDFEVINAAPGYLYQLAYYTNGSTATGPNNQERWIVYKRPRAGYTDTGATQEAIVTLTIPQETLEKSNGVEKIRLVSAGQEYFDVTVDTSKLPAYGSFISSANTNDAGYSWFMHPATYRKKVASDASVTSFNAYISYTASTKTFNYRYRSKDRNYQIVFGPNGANQLPNFKSIGSSTAPDLTSAYTTIHAFDTDWLPPLVFYAVNNADDNNISHFTGGNHASNGDASGDPTATNALYAIFVDGNVLNMSQDFNGACNKIEVKLVHKIMASNTKTTTKRYCLEQTFDLFFDGSCVDVHCKLKALEDIRLRSDYGPQMTAQGFNTTQLMLNAQQTNRVNYDVASNSGKRADFPKTWAIILKGSGGILGCWIDRAYGYGAPENCAPEQPLIRGGGGTNYKFYHCAFRSMYSEDIRTIEGVEYPAFPALLLTPNDDNYKWRGGYVIQSDNGDGTFDSVLKLGKVAAIVNGTKYS
ncbi:hypothetical protein NQ652_02720 [Acinetobacter baumannii]|nr:hypothetical protein [Acinetobacter baumannii]